MKTKFILNFAGVALTLSSFSQIKIFPGGSVSIGATTSPTTNAVMHQIIGGKIVFPATTAAITSAPMIIGQNAVSSSPAFTFHGDQTTGIAHPASNMLAVTIANSEKFRFNSSNQILSVSTTSSASTPDYSWNGDANTGMFHPSFGVLAFSTSGSKRLSINSQGQLLVDNNVGLATYPDYSWGQDANTGMYKASADVIGFSTNGTARMFINSNGQILSSNAPATAATPDYSWMNDPNTGIFNPAADVLAFSTNGTERARFNNAGRLLVGTTIDNGIICANATDYRAATFSVTLNSDWICPTMRTYVNRANSGNYEVNLNGVTKFYVAGQGWIFSDGNYLGSDKNIKEDIKGIDSAMSKVKKINGVLYKLKTQKQNPNTYGTAQEYMGVIAQDVEAVAPQVVKTLPDGTKAVCYEMLVGLLVEALKEQNGKISELEKEVNNCCSKNNPKNNRTITPQNDEADGEINTGSYIKQNAPNPFNKETSIDYFITEKGATSSILVFDMNGKLLKTYKLNGHGFGNLIISGNELSPGMYYYSLIVNAKEVGTKKMVLTE